VVKNRGNELHTQVPAKKQTFALNNKLNIVLFAER